MHINTYKHAHKQAHTHSFKYPTRIIRRTIKRLQFCAHFIIMIIALVWDGYDTLECVCAHRGLLFSLLVWLTSREQESKQSEPLRCPPPLCRCTQTSPNWTRARTPTDNRVGLHNIRVNTARTVLCDVAKHFIPRLTQKDHCRRMRRCARDAACACCVHTIVAHRTHHMLPCGKERSSHKPTHRKNATQFT